ncbi:MAG: NAD(P)-binding domain-containing protein [Polyangiaceae bacterium]
MKFAVLGTGMVGTTISTKLTSIGHQVKLGSRSAGGEKASAWVKAAGPNASEGTYEDAARFAEVVFNCTSGTGSLDALNAAGAANLDGKLLIDIANPLDFSKGMPPTLFTAVSDSLGEQVQRAFPGVRVVKTLNTVNCEVMVDANRVAGGEHEMFVCGNDAAAKGKASELLRECFGWKHIIDIGDISGARATEAYLLLWLRLWGATKTGHFNIKVVR